MDTRPVYRDSEEQRQQRQQRQPGAVAVAATPEMIARMQENNRTPRSGGPGNEPRPGQPQIPGWALGIGVLAGAALAIVTIPTWVPVLGASVAGSDPKVFWYLSRASALVAFGLIWISMASGLLITNRMARVWPGAFTAFDLHQYTSLLGLGFGLFHGVILIGQSYIHYSLVQVLVPFAGADYRPLWVGLGQVSLYVLALVTFTFYIRKQIGTRLWHVIHIASYAAFALSLAHGVLAGTDSGNGWLTAFYWIGGLSILWLTVYRLAARGLALSGKSFGRS